jgi:hypothetical protein
VSGGSIRMAIGDAHDTGSVVPAITARGYQLPEFGQALLSPEVRRRLRNQDCPAHLSLMRWLPDRAVIVPGNDRRLGLIDAKTCMDGNSESLNHAIEFRSILGARVTRIRSFYVCSDLKVLGADDLWEALHPGGMPDERRGDAAIWPCCPSCFRIFRSSTDEMAITDALPEHCPALIRRRTRGSKTPMVRFPKTWCRSLDSVFPSVRGVA